MTAASDEKSTRRDEATATMTVGGPESTCPRSESKLEALRGVIASPVAGRYALRTPLGAGGYGAVWEAKDLLTGDLVAVKLLSSGVGSHLARVRQEISALRLLRLPGVVRLFDEGLDEGRTFLVMERIFGHPFPGPNGRPCPWSDLAGVTVALLETLARVHAVGIVHRDLKPANVLVTPDGRPIILDFGISHFAAPGREDVTTRNELIGTPAYLAPEQCNGDAVTARTDLFSLGLMLYEALSGRLPHLHENVWKLLRARLMEPSPPLRDVAPDVPESVARVIDAMVAIPPEDRPRSAGAVLGMLQGSREISAPSLPRFGSDAPLRALVDAALHGRSAVVVGPPGSGRTRCLDDAAAKLARRGRQILRMPGASATLGSLGPLPEAAELRAGEVSEMVDATAQHVGALLAKGAVLVVDDADRIDPALAAVVSRGRRSGAVLETWPAVPGFEAAPDELVVRLEPAGEEALRGLFAGPDRVLHLQEDAARALFTRSAGLPARVAEEINAWVRAGLCRWEGDRLVIDRDAIERLEGGLRTTAAPAADLDLDADHLDLLGWIELAASQARVSLLARVLLLSPAEVEARIAALAARGTVRHTAAGCLVADSDTLERWPAEQRRSAQQALSAALPAGAYERLLHLVGASDLSRLDHVVAIASAAREIAHRLASDGHLSKAHLVLAEGLRLSRAAGVTESAPIPDLLTLWVEIALAEGRPEAIDRALYELYRIDPRPAALDHLEQLLRAALAALGTPGDQALAAVAFVPPFAEHGLERRRRAIAVHASRLCPEPIQEAVLDEARAWAEGTGDPVARAAAAEWEAHLRYRQGRYDQAADLYAEGARGAAWVTDRILDTIQAASSLMEAFRHEEARRFALEARGLARGARHAYAEGRAEWILRNTAYRLEQPLIADPELVEAVARVGVSSLEAAVCLTEAAVALRAGEPVLCAALARQAREIWSRLDREWPAFLARCLEVGSGAPATAEEIHSLAARALACPEFGFGIQALGLLAWSVPAFTVKRADLDRLVVAIPEARRSLRMDVLSAAEAIARLRVEET